MKKRQLILLLSLLRLLFIASFHQQKHNYLTIYKIQIQCIESLYAIFIFFLFIEEYIFSKRVMKRFL